MRIVLVDEEDASHRLVRSNFHALAPPEWVLISRRRMAPAIEEMSHNPPEALILGLRTPGFLGLKYLRKFTALWPALPVIFFTACSDPDEIWLALTAGAAGYVLESAAPEQLVQAVTEALEGGTFLCQKAQRAIWERLHRAARRRNRTLTPREQEIWVRLLRHTEKEVARDLNLSTQTVHTHVKAIFKKTGMHSRAAALLALLGLR